jgi:hypothetical protein
LASKTLCSVFLIVLVYSWGALLVYLLVKGLIEAKLKRIFCRGLSRMSTWDYQLMP